MGAGAVGAWGGKCLLEEELIQGDRRVEERSRPDIPASHLRIVRGEPRGISPNDLGVVRRRAVLVSEITEQRPTPLCVRTLHLRQPTLHVVGNIQVIQKEGHHSARSPRRGRSRASAIANMIADLSRRQEIELSLVARVPDCKVHEKCQQLLTADLEWQCRKVYSKISGEAQTSVPHSR